MREDKRKRRLKRIRYPPSSWFPLQNKVVSVFSQLREKRSPHLYMAMYERVQRNPSKPFRANISDLSKIGNCDPRTARRCIVELVGEGFVTMVDKGGKLRSRTHKTRFVVPLAEESLGSGHWFPVPRFLVTHYLRKFEGSIVLIALLYHQHLRWKRDCWPGVRRLAKFLGIKPRRVYAYLNTMGHQARWKRLDIGLPWPLEISYSADRKTRHFSVRAAQFYIPDEGTKPVVKLREEFALHFLEKPTPTNNH
jgi:hypothetical protein